MLKAGNYSKIMAISLLVILLSFAGVMAQKVTTSYSQNQNAETLPFEFATVIESNGSIMTVFEWKKAFPENQKIELTISEVGVKNTNFIEVSKNTVRLPMVELGKTYAFNLKSTVRDKEISTTDEYIGEFILNAKDHDNSANLKLTSVYHKNWNSDQTEQIGIMYTRYELEPNNTTGTANRVYDDDDVYGKISSSSDVDYFVISFTSSGNANFWLGSIPAGKDYDLYLYNSSGTELASSRKASNADELISQYPVIAAQNYYVKVVGWNGSFDTQTYYHLRVKNYPTVAGDSYEPNDSFNAATSISSNTTIFANIHATSDVDYFKFTLSTRSNFTLDLTNIPTGCDYDVKLYNSSLSEIGSSTKASNNNENITMTLDSGTYYIKVYSYSGFSNTNYRLAISSTAVAPTLSQWYSQVEATQSTSRQSWNATYLHNLFFPNMNDAKGKLTPFEWNSAKRGNYTAINPSAYASGHMNMWGCYATAYAIILKNLGARTVSSRYDFRTGVTGNLEADPFTITLANTGFPAINYNSSLARYEVPSYTSSNTPVYMYYQNVANAFGYDVYVVNLVGKSALEKAQIISNYLKNHPEGVHCRISASVDGSAAHSLVFYKSTYTTSSSVPLSIPEGRLLTAEDTENDFTEYMSSLESGGVTIQATSAYDSYFTVVDPGTSNPSTGDNVNFTNSWSYTRYGGLPHIVSLHYFVRK